MSERRLKVGIAGLGRAFTLMLPTLVADERVELVAAADPRSEATQRFAADFGARTYDAVEALCANPDVEVVYVATPHQHHAAHVAMATSHGKHVLVEKPMAITLAECRQMIAAAERAGVCLVVGHSHSFDRPILRAREIIVSGAVGAVRMINAQYYTDFLYRPRRPEELVTARGGGVVFSQGAHQIDIVRLLGGGRVRSVRALTGAWNRNRPTEGAFAALLSFDDGAFASILYSGYAHFDSDELCGGIGELGASKLASQYGSARRNLKRAANADQEATLKDARNYGGADYPKQTVMPATGRDTDDARWHQHFGWVLVSCERADLRPLPTGVMIYGDAEARLDALPRPRVPRAEVVDELYDAIVHGRAPLHDGKWAMATLEVCLAMVQSAREGRDITLAHQVAVPS
ncbi:MAG TPA: Gfo/Idh/MocA family oxidoreductase [Casimicrobiaceae bacterium]|nr:Gfo/Idh/MocA family oxidoreductase [Casimicrobiaceae bacterium]